MNSYNFDIVVTDTDSISYRHKDGKPIPGNVRSDLLKELNDISPEFMIWEDDGYYECIVVLKAKNYVLFDGNKITYRGSAIIDQKREPALREMLERMVQNMIFDNPTENLVTIYHEYIRECFKIKDINRWATKKTVTNAVLNGERTNETKVRDALEGVDVQQGDKHWFYNAIVGEEQVGTYKRTGLPKMAPKRALVLVNKFDSQAPNHDIAHLIGRVHDTVCILSNIVALSSFMDYTLKKNADALSALIGRAL